MKLFTKWDSYNHERLAINSWDQTGAILAKNVQQPIF